MFKFLEFDTRDNLVETLTRDLAGLFAERLAEEEEISWAVSGGSTPIPLFHAMAKELIDWSQVQICLVDERWVRRTIQEVMRPLSGAIYFKVGRRPHSSSACGVRAQL